jgi:O-antigen ligase
VWGLPGWRLFTGYRIYLGNDSIWLGLALAMVASGALLTAMHALWRGRVQSAIGWALFGLTLAAALAWFGQSRSALLVFVLAVVVGSVFAGRKWWQRVLAPTLAAVLIVSAYSASPVARERVKLAGEEVVNALALYQVQSSQGQRLALASVSVRVWQDAFWWGHGLGTWREEFAKRVPPQWSGAIGYHTSPHNEYLHILGQMGVIGLGGYVALLLSLLIVGARGLWRTGSPWCFVLALAWIVGSVTNVWVWDFRFFAPFSAMLVCALGALSQHET